MLDVHPPHAPTHTWRDFFIHIATIVIGLFIAVGLEQTVEFFHHRHQVHVARERIWEEARVNQRIVLEDERGIERIEANLDRALILVRKASPKSRGAKPAPTETPDFTFDLHAFYDEAYRSARESGVLSLMPYDESATYEDAYLANANSFKYGIELWSQMYSAKAAMHGKPLNQLDSDEVLPLISAISEARGKAELAQENFRIQEQTWDAILKGSPSRTSSK
jgi:hypothetical protein